MMQTRGRRGSRAGTGPVVATVMLLMVAAPLSAQSESELRVIAGHRAADVAAKADRDSLLAAYPAVLDFLAPGAMPFGELNPAAPPETKQWGRLAGVWYVENRAYVNGQWFCCWNAVWAWRYILDGFAVQDFWYQQTADLPPTVTVQRPSTLTQLRVYRADAKEWFIGFVTSGGKESPAGVWGTFRSYADGPDRMIMEPPPPAEATAPRRRIVFSEFSDDRFFWASEQSTDGGNTWAATFTIEARRIR